MAIRHHAEDTGLEVLDCYEGDGTPADDWKLLSDGAARQAETCRAWLDKLEREAAAKRDSEQESKIVRSNAALVCGLCRTVRKLIADGQIASVEAAYWAWVLGSEAKMLDIRPDEPSVLTGRKVRKAGLDGNESAHGTKAERAARYAAYQTEFDRIIEHNPAIFKTEACRVVAERMEEKTARPTSYKTVLNHVTDRRENS